MDIIIVSIIILIALISIIRSQNTSQPSLTLDGNDNESDSWDSSDGDSGGGD